MFLARQVIGGPAHNSGKVARGDTVCIPTFFFFITLKPRVE